MGLAQAGTLKLDFKGKTAWESKKKIGTNIFAL
jgi:hypothetical protein